jgi:hypothetical protein
MARQKRTTSMCSAIARRTIRSERYCEACAADVERAAYMSALPAEMAETVRYRAAFADAVSVGEVVKPAQRLELVPASGWKSRR